MKKITSAIIVAGGSGKRMNSEVPKQFLVISGNPIIIHTIQKFEKNSKIDAIVIVCIGSYIEKLKELLREYKAHKVYTIVTGGKTRQESSYIGLKACPEGTEYVLIHDAVRPFVKDKAIDDVLNAAIKYGAAGCCIDVTDTIVEVKDGFIGNIPERNILKRMQTPQGFKYDMILKAHDQAVENKRYDITDDCGVMLFSGYSVKMEKGDSDNLKITSKKDLLGGLR